MTPLRVLCIDIEGGSGGSSRSLYELLRHVDRSRVAAEVWCRRPSQMVERYAAEGIACRVEPKIPSYSALLRPSRNLASLGRALTLMRANRKHLASLAHEIDGRFDLVHLNHEGLFLFAPWLRRRADAVITQHIRTRCWDYGGTFARWQARVIERTTGARVFITENEAESFATVLRRSAIGREKRAAVIYNVVSEPAKPPAPDPRIPLDGRFHVASLSNFAAIRGSDRIVDIARTLESRGAADVLFVVAGEETMDKRLPGDIGAAARRGLGFGDFVKETRLTDRILVLGHVADPERVLAGCDMLIKPTREANPWGRDILESLAAGKPALSFGTYDRFLEDGVTGVLMRDYDPAAVVDAILTLAGDRARCKWLGAAGRNRIAALCDGPRQAAKLVALWERSAARSAKDTSGGSLSGQAACAG